MSRSRAPLAGAALVVAAMLVSSSVAAGQAESDTAGARKVFEANIDAIHKRDRTRYLSYYIETETLARNGTGGLEQGYKDWAAIRDNTWPDTLVARDLRMVPIAPGVVYGTYHYRQVVHNGPTIEGISERIFVKTAERLEDRGEHGIRTVSRCIAAAGRAGGRNARESAPACGAERDGGRARAGASCAQARVRTAPFQREWRRSMCAESISARD